MRSTEKHEYLAPGVALGEGEFKYSYFCDICGWGDTCTECVSTSYGVIDLCHRHKDADIKKWVDKGTPHYDPDKKMRALSIQQPWAWAIINLPAKIRKDVENRTWQVKFRERILVHAPLKYDHKGAEWIRKTFNVDVPGSKDLPLGGFIGSVEIVDCVEQLDSQWFFGLFGFVLRNPIEIPFRVAKGQQRFFNVGK